MGWNVVIYEHLYAQMNIFYYYLLVTNINFITGLTSIHYIMSELIVSTSVDAPFCLPDKCSG
jgi:hypothetical protein